MLKKAVLMALASLFVLPFVFLPVLSLAAEWRFPELLPQRWTMAHWALASNANWLSSAAVSLSLATTTAFLSTVLGFVTARHLAWHKRRGLFLTLAYLPYVFSPVIYAHCLKFFFNVSSLSGTWPGVLLAQFFLCYPFAFLLFFNHFDQRLKAMEQLTYTLGGDDRAVFWRVLVPVSIPALLLCFFQSFLISWFEYGLTAVIGLGQVHTLPIGVFQYIGEANQYVAALAGCLVCLPPLILLWFNQRFLAHRLAS